MRRTLLLAALLPTACTSDPDEVLPDGFEGELTCADFPDAGTCVALAGGDAAGLLQAVNALEDDTVVVLGAGTFALDNQVTLRNVARVQLVGQGMDATVLDFSGQAAQGNGVDAVGEDLVFEGFTVADARKDGLRVEDSRGVVIRGVRATWVGGPSPDNGAYGIYPVKSFDVLVENSEARHASDAGLYIGQCVRAIIRNNLASGNVAGLEIENTQYVDVYGNTVEDNTGGLLVFDLPGNPVIGRDVRIRDNVIRNNNRENFAPGGVVRQIPAGTGTFALASRRVEITGNTFENNHTTDIAVLSGLVIEGSVAAWRLPTDELVGTWDDLDLPADDGGVMNFRTSDVWIHGNTHVGAGTDVDDGDMEARELGFLLGLLYGDTPVDAILYDAIGEGAYDADDPAGNSNDHRICLGDEGGATFASLDVETLAARLAALDLPTLDDVFRPAPPYAPFDCEGLAGGPIADVTLDVP